jgi:hypothetical protein
MRTWAICAVAAGLLVLAGCGSRPAGSSAGSAPAAGIAGPALATSLSSGNGTSWAVVQMGGSAAQYNNFWELFVRPAGTSSWKLATPGGVASNGGLVAAATGAGSLLVGFRPSQGLTFSPLAATTDQGAQWSQNALLGTGLANLPSALAASPAGRLLALTDTGDIEVGTRLGANWTRLTTERALASTPAGRACSLTGLTAAAWTQAGAPLLAGSCLKTGIAGIFTLSAGSWRAVGPTLPASLTSAPVSVIALATEGTRTTVILAVGTGAATALEAAWSANGGSTWALSPELRTGAGGKPSVSFGADGSASLGLTASRAATIGWQAAGWRTLPSLPAGTATLAATPDGQPEALAVKGGTLTVWQLGPGSGSWALVQTAQVTIPYGSSS